MPIVEYDTRCNVALTIEDLEQRDPEGAQALREAADNPAWACSTLSRTLRARGIDLGMRSLQRHRRRDCRCPASPTT